MLQQRELLAADFALPNDEYVESAAEQTAEIQPTILDVNRDGVWTALDPLLIVNAIASGWGTHELPTGDLNHDAMLDSMDVEIAFTQLELNWVGADNGIYSAGPAGPSNPTSGNQIPYYCALIKITSDYEGPCLTGESGPSGPSGPIDPSGPSGPSDSTVTDGSTSSTSTTSTSDDSDPSGSSTSSDPSGPYGPGTSGAGSDTEPPGSGDSANSGDPSESGSSSEPSDSPDPDSTTSTGGSPDPGTPSDSGPPPTSNGSGSTGPAGPGGAAGGDSGSDGGTGSSSPSGPSPLTMVAKFGMTGGTGSSAPTKPGEVYEGDTLWIHGEFQGGDGQTVPVIEASVDANFDDDFADPKEHFRIVHTSGQAPSFMQGWLIEDDGPIGGNGQPTDAINTEITFGGVKLPAMSGKAINVAPKFTQPPTLNWSENADGKASGTVFVSFNDPGIFDAQKLQVFDSASPTAGGLVETLGCDRQAEGEPYCLVGHSETVPFAFYTPANQYVNHFPVTARVTDDDSGSAAFVFDRLDLLLNSDDDNDNKISDLFDRGSTDSDVKEFKLTDYFPDGQNAGNGTFTLVFGNDTVRVWDSPTKDRLLGGYYDDYGYGYTAERSEYINQESVWIEGVRPGTTEVTLVWQKGKPANGPENPSTLQSEKTYGGTATVTVWGIDYDIDSDNDKPLARPDHSEWEEFLEDDEYGIGKLIRMPSNFDSALDGPMVPSEIHLLKNLDETQQTIAKIEFDFSKQAKSGDIRVWAGRVDDTTPPISPSASGRLEILPGTQYSLDTLGYHPGSGTIVVWIEGRKVKEGHRILREIEEDGRPTDEIKAILTMRGAFAGVNCSDKIKYMLIEDDSLFHYLNERSTSGRPGDRPNGQMVRTALASRAVYDHDDIPKFGIEILTDSQLRDLGLPSEARALLTGELDSGFKASMFHDHVTNSYIVAFAGVELTNTDDIRTAIEQGLGYETKQYKAAAILGRELSTWSKLRAEDNMSVKLILTGHSLGGGLASLAYATSGFTTDTFNSAGLNVPALSEAHGGDPPLDMQYPQIIDNLRNSTSDIIEAYHLEYDLLTILQRAYEIMPDPIGKPIELEGSVDDQINNNTLNAIVSFEESVLDIGGLIDSVWPFLTDRPTAQAMMDSHVITGVLYGVLVEEELITNKILWDVYMDPDNLRKNPAQDD